MDFKVGQKVAYPNHGVCAVEAIGQKKVSGSQVDFYTLRVLANNSAIYVPRENAEAIGIRSVINSLECNQLMKILAEDFTEGSGDWKVRVREYTDKIQSGDIFQICDVLKKLIFLTFSKQLSFREQRLLEKAKFLVVSEMAVVCSQSEAETEKKVDKLLSKACQKHQSADLQAVSVAVS